MNGVIFSFPRTELFCLFSGTSTFFS